jgi:hypothetical protein
MKRRPVTVIMKFIEDTPTQLRMELSYEGDPPAKDAMKNIAIAAAQDAKRYIESIFTKYGRPVYDRTHVEDENDKHKN